jgi:hypothetical protein
VIDPDRACPHENFAAEVDVNRLMDGDNGRPDVVIGYNADVRVRCADCDEKFRWIGVPAGLMPSKPMVSVDETELRAPLRPASSDHDFGMGIPGFAMTMSSGMRPEPREFPPFPYDENDHGMLS